MKKFLAILAVVLVSCCEVKVEPRTATANRVSNSINVTSYSKDGVEYIIFESGISVNGGRSVYVINHTKELLEIELLKKQIR